MSGGIGRAPQTEHAYLGGWMAGNPETIQGRRVGRLTDHRTCECGSVSANVKPALRAALVSHGQSVSENSTAQPGKVG